MQVNDKLELENVRKYHYVYMGTASFDKVFKKLVENRYGIMYNRNIYR